MKKVFKLEGLDCAHCASKLEKSINKIDKVVYAQVNFMTLKLTIEIEDNEFDEVMEEILKVTKKTLPDCIIKR